MLGFQSVRVVSYCGMLFVHSSIANQITLGILLKFLSLIKELTSIFQDKSVTQSIPTCFQNPEPPIICYKCNKPIRNTILNFNKLVSDLVIHANTSKS